VTLKELFEKCLYANYTHTDNDGDYAISLDDDTIYILFECSDDKGDWKNNFDFPATPYKQMDKKWYCHRGFLAVWKAMRDEVKQKVAELVKSHPDAKNIVCVGYSHGGPLSVLATEDMEYSYGETHAVKGYGFGAPRVIWGIMPKSVKYRLRNFYTVRNIPDIVTHVPPKILGFRDAGTMIEIGAPDKYNPIEAHFPVSYLNELDKGGGNEE
jgi:hypothetical protein